MSPIMIAKLWRASEEIDIMVGFCPFRGDTGFDLELVKCFAVGKI